MANFSRTENPNGSGTVTIVPIPAHVSWASPASVSYGTALGATQLDAVANVPGTFIYSPAADTVLPAGTQTLTAIFKPADSIDYTSTPASTTITVTPATPTVVVKGGLFPLNGNPHAASASATGVLEDTLTPVTIAYNGLTTVPSAAGIYSVLATFAGNANYGAATASTTIVISSAPVLDARSAQSWFQGQWPSRHLALFPDGQILVETGNNYTFPVLNPATGNGTLFPGQFSNGALGVQPNPIIWADPSAAYVLGDWGQTVVYGEDGTWEWSWDNVFGCCNVYGFPMLATDRGRRRVLGSFGDRLYTIQFDSSGVIGDVDPRVAFTPGQATGMVTATTDVAYVGGGPGYYPGVISKYDLTTSPNPTLLWSQALGSNSIWNLSEGAIASDGSFTVTGAGNHASGYWTLPDVWRAGDLFWISADGQTTWSQPALATTPPVIGGSGLIYVGGLAAAGAPQSQLDGAGIVHAFDETGNEVWSTATAGMPQDLFVGDDGKVYVLTGGTTEGAILALDQATGTLELGINHLPMPWEMILSNGVVYVTGDSGVVAVPLPAGFAGNYDPQSPWPVRQNDNQRSSQHIPLAATSLTASAISASFGGSASLSATLTSGGNPVSGQLLTFALFGTIVGSATTDANGAATLGSVSLAGHAVGTYSGTLQVTFATNLADAGSTATSSVTIVPATSSVLWVLPAAITYGTPLGATQLDAGSSIPGTFTYNPQTGTVLSAGSQTLSVTFTPTDATDYTTASATVPLMVLPTTPTLTWPAPGTMIVGTPLGSSQLDATANTPGTFAYSPAAGALLPIGSQTLSVTFTPTDSLDYTPASASVTMTTSYGTCVLFDQTKSHMSGSTVPIQLEVCDATGTNLSAASLPVFATGVFLTSTNAPGVLDDSGDANPDDQFRFAGGSYIFNLSLKGFATGTYTLVFTVGTDPTAHTVQFQVR